MGRASRGNTQSQRRIQPIVLSTNVGESLSAKAPFESPIVSRATVQYLSTVHTELFHRSL